MIPGYPRGSGGHTHEWNGLDSKIIGSDAEYIPRMGHGGSSKLVPCWNTDLTWPNLLMFHEMSEIWIFVKFLDYTKNKNKKGRDQTETTLGPNSAQRPSLRFVVWITVPLSVFSKSQFHHVLLKSEEFFVNCI